MSGRAVISGATLRCSHGDASAPLLVAPLQSAKVLFAGEKPTATLGCHLPGQNIFPFGTCRTIGGPCVPMTPGEWLDDTSTIVGQRQALSDNGKLGCEIGGTISVEDPAQQAVDIGALGSQYTKNLGQFTARFGNCREPFFSEGRLLGFIYEEERYIELRMLDGGVTWHRDDSIEETNDIDYLIGGGGLVKALGRRTLRVLLKRKRMRRGKPTLSPRERIKESFRKQASKGQDARTWADRLRNLDPKRIDEHLEKVEKVVEVLRTLFG